MFRSRDNSHVVNILPLTTLRTIDLGGKKNSDPLFSRFCAEQSVFFEGNSAPEFVQLNFSWCHDETKPQSAARMQPMA